MMTAEHLKGSILQLAMQGKLVEQRTNEREVVFKKGKDKETEELDFEIPMTWITAHLETVVDSVASKQYQIKESEVKPEGEYRVISQSKEYSIGYCNDNSKLYHHAQPVIVFGDHTTEVKFIDFDFVVGADGIKIFNPKTNIIEPRFLFYQLQFYTRGLNKVGGYSRHYKFIKNKPIVIPPLAEQKRIVAKFEELMPFVEQYAAASTKLNTLNTTFPDMMKKSILQEAVQGKLVPQDPNDEPASVLLKKIAEEKKRLIKEGKIKKENELPPITDTEIPFDIPESWEWARLGSLITVRGGKRLPVGKQLITEKTEHVYIRVTDMKNETVDMTDLHYLTEDVYKLISSYIIKKEDIFIVIVGSTIGKAGIIPDELDGMNLTENAARLTPYFVDKRFLLKMITSDFMQAQFVDRTHQVGQPKLALFRLKEAIIPIPPLNEQKRIVERLERFEPEILSLKNNLFR